MAKYGITLEQTLWHLPLACLNQLVVYDELANGRAPRWCSAAGETDIADLLAGAMTPQA